METFEEFAEVNIDAWIKLGKRKKKVIYIKDYKWRKYVESFIHLIRTSRFKIPEEIL